MCPALTPSIGQKKITVKSETLESFKINIALIDQNTVHLSFKTFFWKMWHCLLNKNPHVVYFQLILVRTRERIVRPKIDIMQVHLFLKRAVS